MANENIMVSERSTGKKKAIKPFKLTARNAIAPENVTRNEDHPERNPINLP
jgi:hypothetical protein